MPVRPQKPAPAPDRPGKVQSFEIYVRPGFSHLELSSVIAVLQAASALETGVHFTWQVASDLPGLVSSSSEILVRAEPAIGDQYLKDYLFVTGGRNCRGGNWMQRARAMQKLRRPVFLLSDAATAYIRSSARLSGPVTTHWQDARALAETGDYPTVSNRLAEENAGIFTCAGHAHTAEIVIRLLSGVLSPQDCAELTSAMTLETARGFSGEQPKGAGGNFNFLGGKLAKAVAIMEESVETPLPTAVIAERAGLSVRHLERLFLTHLDTTPARHYRRVRLKLAGKLIADTSLPVVDIALACGFPSSASLAKAYRHEFGVTPHQLRNSKKGGRAG
ncbi:GlxA family transcriptional regulator [Leisingera sp. ANG-M1]|uniref:GlxA family transcriptional regulator n=1 Tax=Leisingera sp. ANG-M1 TaxID=1577895 RepID=UPI00126A4A5F|nr:helix-turn-helix domain-containing protein [Leisingera sp. ANG-M1]